MNPESFLVVTKTLGGRGLVRGLDKVQDMDRDIGDAVV